jgi:benzoyl-CoA-dihydrodiol lyase
VSLAARPALVTFDTDPSRYRHWRLDIDPPIATLTLAVDEDAPDGYALKLNSYDLFVDIELADAVRRLRFEHPEVGAVVITGGLEKVFCAGANIRMLAQSSHHHKVNFCKFTNETRLQIEDASAHSGQVYLCALNGTASGGGYELALACEHIVLVDDGSSAVSLPEVPLLGVLPGTGGLTRLVDKRKVRRDLADVFSTKAEGIRGRQAVEWGLVDEVVPRSRFADAVRERALELSSGARGGTATTLTPLSREVTDASVAYEHVRAELDRTLAAAIVTVHAGDPLETARQIDDLVLHLRFNEPELGTIVLKTAGDASGFDEALAKDTESVLLWKRTLKRLECSARTIFALVEPGSCFTGTLAELVLCADRTYMLDADGVALTLTAMNFGPLPAANGRTRVENRGLDAGPGTYDAQAALDAGLVTFAPDDLDWDDEVRLALEERASFSPDALTAMEANLRFPGPETLETKIFGRLSAWQNWVFSRPNATGPDGALPRYGTGVRPAFDKGRT